MSTDSQIQYPLVSRGIVDPRTSVARFARFALVFTTETPSPPATKVGNRYDMELTSTAIMAKYRNRVLDHVLKNYAHNHAHMLVLDLDLGVSARAKALAEIK